MAQEMVGLTEVRQEIAAALALVRHDRWTVGGLRGGGLAVIADSSRRTLRPGARVRELAPLARRCVHERQPLAVSSVMEPAAGARHHDWELDWPAVLYAPIGRPRGRLVGLLTIGSRSPHWYVAEEVAFVRDLADMLIPWVVAMGSGAQPFGERERRLPYLVR